MVFHISLNELDEFANKFWRQVRETKVFAFHGEMGAGKTTFITSLCRAKGVEDRMGSPTFSIINEYSYIEDGQSRKIFHIDLYRLKDEEEVIQAGIEDAVYSDSICMVEWPEKAPRLFDEQTMNIFIQVVSVTKRSIEIRMPSML